MSDLYSQGMNHKRLERLVEREVIHCASCMISDLAQNAYRDDETTFLDLCMRDDFETAIDESDEVQEITTSDDETYIIASDVELYSALYNLPGCMPDAEPSLHIDVDEAKDSLQESLESHYEEMEETAEREKAYQTAMDDIRTHGQGYFEDYTYSVNPLVADFSFISADELENLGIDCVKIESVEDYQEACDEFSIEPEQREAYEHWIVSRWFAEKLQEQGEIVGAIFDFHIWGRCTTGQAISLDGVIARIAHEMEILEGQQHEWKVG